MVSPAERAKSRIEFRGLELHFRKNFSDLIGPDVLEVERDLGPAVEFHVASDQVSLEEGHTAADVPTNEVWIDKALGHECRAQRAAFTWMQIRKPNAQAHTFQLG